MFHYFDILEYRILITKNDCLKDSTLSNHHFFLAQKEAGLRIDENLLSLIFDHEKMVQQFLFLSFLIFMFYCFLFIVFE